MGKYGIVEEIPEGIVWFEPVTDVRDEYVLRTNDDTGAILYTNARLDCLEAFVEGVRHERTLQPEKSAKESSNFLSLVWIRYKAAGGGCILKEKDDEYILVKPDWTVQTFQNLSDAHSAVDQT